MENHGTAITSTGPNGIGVDLPMLKILRRAWSHDSMARAFGHEA